MAAWGDGPVGSASVAGVASGGGLAIGGTIAKGLALAGTIWGTSTTNNFEGGPFNQATIIGVRGNALGVPANPNATASLAEIGLLSDWFPDPSGGWHVGASAGLGAISVLNQADNSSWTGLGVSGSVFGGHDWWVGRSWSFGLMLVASGASRAALNDSNRNDTGYRVTPFSLGVGWSILYY